MPVKCRKLQQCNVVHVPGTMALVFSELHGHASAGVASEFVVWISDSTVVLSM